MAQLNNKEKFEDTKGVNLHNTKQKTKDWATWTPLKRMWIQLPRKVTSSCSTSGARRDTKLRYGLLSWMIKKTKKKFKG